MPPDEVRAMPFAESEDRRMGLAQDAQSLGDLVAEQADHTARV